MAPLFGVNTPYLGGEYGHDLAPNGRFPEWPCRFDPMLAYRPIVEAKMLGFGAVRIWLCENAEGIVVDGSGRVESIHPALLESVRILQEAAALHGIGLYFCLLDGNAWAREKDPITRSILADADQAARFADRVVSPLAKLFDPRITVGIDVINEPETATADCIDDPAVDPIPWENIGHTFRTARAALRTDHPRAWITAGSLHVFLPKLLAAIPDLDAVDVHIYHPNGGIPSRQDLSDYTQDPRFLDPAFPLLAGELGIPKPDPEDPEALTNYLHNARSRHYTAAFLWQLEGDLIDKTHPRRPWTHQGTRIHTELSLP